MHEESRYSTSCFVQSFGFSSFWLLHACLELLGLFDAFGFLHFNVWLFDLLSKAFLIVFLENGSL